MKRIAFFVGAAFCLAAAGGPANGEELRGTITANKVVDLTHQMYEGMAFWPGGVPFKMERLVDYPQGYRLHKFEVGENTGTHVDAPKHFVTTGTGIAGIPLSDLIVQAAVIDIQDKVASDPDYRLTAFDVEQWEGKHGPIPRGSLVILNTGWHKRFADPEVYVNMDNAKVMHFPGFHANSAPVLIDRGVVGVGIDTLSLDHGPAKSFDFHTAMLNANKYQIENLANLDALPARGATVVVGVLPVRDGTQAQARVIAFVP